jgi:hypothetical protein
MKPGTKFITLEVILHLCPLCRMCDVLRSHLQRTKGNKRFWEELTAYFPWYDTGHTENDASNNSSIIACVFVTAVTFLLSRCLATIGGFFLPSRCLATIWRFLPSRCLANIGGFLPSRCLATISVFFTESLPSNYRGDTHTKSNVVS